MVVVKTFDNYFSANIVLGRLQHEGVRCYLKDENTVTIDPLLNGAIGGIKLCVQKNDVALAIALLQEFEEQYIKEAACPRCQVHDMDKKTQQVKPDFLTKLIRYFVKNLDTEQETIYFCHQCGYESRTLPDKYAYYNVV